MRATAPTFERPRVPRWLAVSVLYVIVRTAADFGSHWLRLNDGFSLWYPPVGIDVMVLAVFGPWYAPAVGVAQAISLATSGFGATGWTVGAYVSLHVALYTTVVTFATTRLRMDPRLSTLRDAVLFTGWLVFLLPLLTAVGKVSLLVATGSFVHESLGDQMVALAVGDGTGIAMTAPLLLLLGGAAPQQWWEKPLRAKRLRLPRDTQEWMALGFHAVLTIVAVVFAVGTNQRNVDLNYVMAIPVIWAALSYGFPGAVASVFAVNITVAMILAPNMPGIALSEDPLGIQLALFAISSSGVLIGALVGQERDKRFEAETATRKFYSAFRSSPDPIVLTRLSDFAIVEVNDAYTRVSGFTSRDTIGASIVELGIGTPADEARLRSGLASGSARNQEFEFTVADGGNLTCLLSSESFDVDGEEYFITVVRDITEQRQLEHELLDASEREQRRLGRELHDHLGQTLTGISYLSQSLAAHTEEVAPELASQHALVGAQLGQAIGELRAIAHGLNPSGVSKDDLCSALSALAEDVSVRFDVACGFAAEASVTMASPEALTHVYRIVQEAITNAIRHGSADSIEISITEPTKAGVCTLTVEDDGVGIEESNVGTGGLGIRNMQFRAAQVGGSMAVSDTGHGTRVRCSFNAVGTRRPSSVARVPLTRA